MEIGDENEQKMRRSSSMMSSMTDRIRRLSVISTEVDQDLRGLGIVVLVTVFVLIFIVCFDWMDFYIFVKKLIYKD